MSSPRTLQDADGETLLRLERLLQLLVALPAAQQLEASNRLLNMALVVEAADPETPIDVLKRMMERATEADMRVVDGQVTVPYEVPPCQPRKFITI